MRYILHICVVAKLMGVPPWQIVCDEVWHCMPCSPHTGQHTICKLQGWAFQLNDRPIVQTLAQTHMSCTSQTEKTSSLPRWSRHNSCSSTTPTKSSTTWAAEAAGCGLADHGPSLTHASWLWAHGWLSKKLWKGNVKLFIGEYPDRKHTHCILTALFIWLGPSFSSVAEPLPVDAVSTQEKLAASWQSL